MLIKQHSFIQKRFLLFLFCSLFSPLFLLAQNIRTVSPVSESKWQLSTTVIGVQFFYRITECAGKKVVFLKFNNTNKKAVNISWNEAFVTKEGNELAKASSYEKKQLELLPGIMEQPNCETATERNLIARPTQKTPVYSAEIVSFSFTGITVK